MAQARHKPLRVLLANESADLLDRLASLVAASGHEVVARETDAAAVADVAARVGPDVALVVLGPSREHALGLVEQIVRRAACPVVTLLAQPDPEYVRAAAEEGVFAYLVAASGQDLELTLRVTLERFGQYSALQGAFGRRATIEQAKGILMAQRGMGAEAAFELLRDESQRSGRRVHDLAAAVVEEHGVLLTTPPGQPASGAS